MWNPFLTYPALYIIQNFVLSLSESNWLSNKRNILFTEQSTSALFPTELRNLTNAMTDIGAKFDIIREGGYLID